MILTIENEYLKVNVKNKGAEVTSIKTINDDFEYLWQSDPHYWAKQSPILFPIVGSVPNNKYRIDDREYEIEIPHGFAKESMFDFVCQSSDSLTYRLASSSETRKKYPYEFELEVQYKLEGNELIVKNIVKNNDVKTMWFSIGAHPGFVCPFNSGEIMEDYYLEFECEEYIERMLVDNGFRTGEQELFLNNEKVVRLSSELFDRSTIILKDLKSKAVSIRSDKTPRQVTVKFDGFPYLGIWSSRGDAPFVCIEPWYGVTSKLNDNGDFTEKEGIISLASGEVFKCEYSVVIR